MIIQKYLFFLERRQAINYLVFICCICKLQTTVLCMFCYYFSRVTVLSVNDQKQPIYQESSGIKQVHTL
jgi:hypothetical protein